MLYIVTGKLRQASASCQRAAASASYSRNHPLLTSNQSLYPIRRLLAKQQQYQQLLTNLGEYLSQSAQAYETAEQRIQKAWDEDVQPVPEPFWNTKVSYRKALFRRHTSISADKGIMGYINNGVCAGIFAGFTAAEFKASKSMPYLQMQGDVKVGSVSVSGDAKAVLKQNDAWNPALILEAKANAAVATAAASIRLGNEMIHADGEISGGVGVASAEAKAIIGKDEITLKAEAGAAALQGEVKGSFSIFGATITLSGSGEIGSIGGGAQFSSKKGEWEFGGKLSLIAGLGFKVKVNYG